VTIHSNGLLRVGDLTVHFRQRRRAPVVALDRVSLEVASGETVALVGESGSGKTTLGRVILGLVPPDRGSIVFRGEEITHASREERRSLSAHLQLVDQDPYGSLNPSRTIAQTLVEPLRVHRRLSSTEQREEMRKALELVGLTSNVLPRYPRAFSGGQRQRIAIARALIAGPEIVIADEPVSALDLSTQAQVLNVFANLRMTLGVSFLFISHNLAVVEHIADRIVVLYRGRVVESGPAEVITRGPVHPYTRALLAAVPVPDPKRQAVRRRQRRELTRGTTETATALGVDACIFAPRCPHRREVCATARPPLEMAASGALVACVRHTEIGGAPDEVALTR
jgi:oligopeptide/dipeptide ABC transporter ATP-binding protein